MFTMRTEVTHNKTNRYFIHSFANGLELLECFGQDHEGLTLTFLAQKLGWTKTSTYRYPSVST